MGKLDQIKQAINKASDNDATKAIKYLLWYIESQSAELEFLRRVADKTITGSPEKNAANQIEYERRRVDSSKSLAQEHDELVARFKKNV